MRSAEIARCGASVNRRTSSTVEEGIAYGGMMRFSRSTISSPAISVPQRAPARAYAFDSVRSTTRFGSSPSREVRLARLENSMYASSTHTSACAASAEQIDSIARSSSRLPVGLFGEQRNTILARRPASITASVSSAKPASSSGTSTTSAPWMRAATL